MSTPCEVAVKCVLPSIRALIAKELTTKHHLKQAEAAKRLRVSQPAISLYYRKIRGKAINLEDDADIKKLIEKLAESQVNDELSYKKFVQAFCEICRTIRSKGLLCKIHKTFDPTVDIEKCELCTVTNSLKCM